MKPVVAVYLVSYCCKYWQGHKRGGKETIKGFLLVFLLQLSFLYSFTCSPHRSRTTSWFHFSLATIKHELQTNTVIWLKQQWDEQIATGCVVPHAATLGDLSPLRFNVRPESRRIKQATQWEGNKSSPIFTLIAVTVIYMQIKSEWLK